MDEKDGERVKKMDENGAPTLPFSLGFPFPCSLQATLLTTFNSLSLLLVPRLSARRSATSIAIVDSSIVAVFVVVVVVVDDFLLLGAVVVVAVSMYS